MSRCLKCGGPLPPLGDCSQCRSGLPPGRRIPPLLSQELKLDRRADIHGIDQRPPPRPPPVLTRGRPQPFPPGSPADGTIFASVAPLWRRAGATLVDLIAVLAVGALYLAVAAAVVGVQQPPSQLTGIDVLMVRAHALEKVLIPGAVLVVILAGAYGTAFSWLWEGRTLGRRLFGLQLVDRTGMPPTPLRAIIRGVLSLFSFALFLGGFWLMLFDRRGQTLHDKLTSTFVVRPG